MGRDETGGVEVETHGREYQQFMIGSINILFQPYPVVIQP